MNDRPQAPEIPGGRASGSSGDAEARLGCRSILFVPGDRPDRYGKALAAGADAVCVDLEDAVAPQRKAVARAAVARFLAEKRAGSSQVVVRVNDPETDLGRTDAAALAGIPRPDVFMIPKVKTAAGVRYAARLLGEDVRLLPLIETVRGLENAARIASAGPAVIGVIFGGFDLAIELGAEPRWEALLYARSRVIHVAALSGIDAIDMPSRDFREMSGLREEAVKARRLGFSGKAAIHPAQLPVIHEVFTPSRTEVRRALRVVEADRAADGGAVAIEGRMVDRPVVEAARRVLAQARWASTAE